MGYVPPSAPTGLLVLPKGLSFSNFEAYRTLYLANGAYPQMAGLPRTYDEYRRSLYGDHRRDWLPVLSYGFIIAVAVLVIAVAMVLVSLIP